MIALQFIVAVILVQGLIVLALHRVSKAGQRDDRQSRIAMVKHNTDAIEPETNLQYLERMLEAR